MAPSYVLVTMAIVLLIQILKQYSWLFLKSAILPKNLSSYEIVTIRLYTTSERRNMLIVQFKGDCEREIVMFECSESCD